MLWIRRIDIERREGQAIRVIEADFYCNYDGELSTSQSLVDNRLSVLLAINLSFWMLIGASEKLPFSSLVYWRPHMTVKRGQSPVMLELIIPFTPILCDSRRLKQSPPPTLM